MQTREGIKKIIAANPTNLTIKTYPTRTNAAGETVTNYDGTPTETIIGPVRIARNVSKVQKLEDTQGGPYHYTDNFIMLSDYETELTEGLTFDYNNRTYRIKTVDRLYKESVVIGYQAELEDIKAGVTV